MIMIASNWRSQGYPGGACVFDVAARLGPNIKDLCGESGHFYCPIEYEAATKSNDATATIFMNGDVTL